MNTNTSLPSKPICSSENPAPVVLRETSNTTRKVWNYDYTHPDVIVRCIDEDHEDYEYYCPHCGMTKIVEGSDY